MKVKKFGTEEGIIIFEGKVIVIEIANERYTLEDRGDGSFQINKTAGMYVNKINIAPNASNSIIIK